MQVSSPLLSQEERLALMEQGSEETRRFAPIRLVFADPHPVVLEGLKKSFANHPDFGIIRSLTDGSNAWREVLATQPDVLIIELTLDGMSSMQLIRALRQAGWPTKVIVFSLASNPLWIEALAEGVQGLVSKNKSNTLLMDCVRAVHEGHKWLDEEFRVSKISGTGLSLMQWDFEARLTQKEKLIVEALLRGVSNKEIASELEIKEGTVKTHLKNVYRKLGCANRVELLSRSRHQN